MQLVVELPAIHKALGFDPQVLKKTEDFFFLMLWVH